MADQPRKEWRPVYVEYVAVRRCYRNPSWTRAKERLPELHREFLWDTWKKRHPEDTRIRVKIREQL